MVVYRITRTRYIDDLSGEGSRLNGGRWNSPGIAALYAADFRSLALLETLVHTPFKMLHDYSLAEIILPDEAPVYTFTPDELPSDWDAFPGYNNTALIGDRLLLENHFFAIRIPSALLPEEYNWVINTRHPLMPEVKLVVKRPVVFNERFKKMLQ
jgi:RES domain-containing protein